MTAISHSLIGAEVHSLPALRIAVSGASGLIGRKLSEFTKTLGDVLHRPAFFPMPAFVAKMVLGEMADELLLSSMRVVPAKLRDTGYNFRFSDLDGALRHEPQSVWE